MGGWEVGGGGQERKGRRGKLYSGLELNSEPLTPGLGPGPQGSRLTKSKESSEGTGKMPQQGNDRALSELFRNNQGGVGPVLMRDEAVSDTVGAL